MHSIARQKQKTEFYVNHYQRVKVGRTERQTDTPPIPVLHSYTVAKTEAMNKLTL